MIKSEIIFLCITALNLIFSWKNWLT